MAHRYTCAVCDAPMSAYGVGGTRCARCSEPCRTCDGDVACCTHPLPKRAREPAERGMTLLRTFAADVALMFREFGGCIRRAARDMARDVRETFRRD